MGYSLRSSACIIMALLFSVGSLFLGGSRVVFTCNKEVFEALRPLSRAIYRAEALAYSSKEMCLHIVFSIPGFQYALKLVFRI